MEEFQAHSGPPRRTLSLGLPPLWGLVFTMAASASDDPLFDPGGTSSVLVPADSHGRPLEAVEPARPERFDATEAEPLKENDMMACYMPEIDVYSLDPEPAHR